ncbi:hypothetical protein V1527DRAFT_224173 [Lipomyces starkeyi]
MLFLFCYIYSLFRLLSVPSLIWTFLLFSTFFPMECYRITSRARVIDCCTLSTPFVTLHDLLFFSFCVLYYVIDFSLPS